MSTKPQPVPWPDVIDLVDDLFEWLVANGHATKSDDPQGAAWRVLGMLGTNDSLPSRIAGAICDLEMYRGAGRREDELQNSAVRSKLSEEARRLIYDDSVEREAERVIRALFPRFELIRRLVAQTAERKKLRRGLLPLRPEVVQTQEAHDQVQHDAVLAHLSWVVDATSELHAVFDKFNPAATLYPLTLSGWREFEKTIRTELGELGFKRGK